jgi:hypothetical protein
MKLTMKPNPFDETPTPDRWPLLDQMKDPLKALADLVHNHPEDSANRTVTTTTLLLSLWQLAGRGMTHRAPSLVLVNTHGEQSGPMDALAASLVNPRVDTGPRLHKEGPFAQGTPEMAPNAMAGAILRYHERRKQANRSWVLPELQMLEARYFAAQDTGFGYGGTRPYAMAWNDLFGWMTNRDCQAILRVESANDLAMFREHVVHHPERLQAAHGYGPGLEMVSKRLCLSGAITPEQWDAEFAGRAVELGLPLLFLPEPVSGPDNAAIPPALEFMLALLPKAFHEPMEDPANLIEGEWFAHYGKLLRTRLRMLPPEYDYSVQRLARQLFPVSLRLTAWAGHWSGASAGECEALALDLCAHALRGVTIGVAGLAWHGLGFDPGCDRAKALKALAYLRTKGPMTLSDLTRHGKVKKPLRGPLLERFVAENLVRVDGKMVAPTTYEEFVAALYARNEFPEPANHWELAAGRGGTAT